MPERIETAQIKSVDVEDIEIDDRYPGTFGFIVNLTRDPGPEWAVEFEAAYEGARYAGKPPAVVRGAQLCIFYLPRYADDLPAYFRFLSRIITETNQAVDLRNKVLPDEEREKQAFLVKLREASASSVR